MSRPPNIVLFVTDDHGAWAAGCYGNREIRSPALDRLAAEGVRFASAFTPCPVCSPARACLFTGRTPSQVGIHDWLQEQDPEIGEHDWLAEEVTLPEILRDVGYHCLRVGKWHMGRSHHTPRGFDRSFAGRVHTGPHFGEIEYLEDGRVETIAGAKTAVLTDRALRYVDEAPGDRPFFLYVGYTATHSPYQAAAHDPAAVARYADAAFTDIPPYVPHPWHKNEGLAGGPGAADEDVRTRYQGYYAAVSEIDRGVGRIVEHLRATGRLDDTLVVYTADHGCALGHHGFWGKGNSTRPLNMYDTSIRVPLMARGPGVAAGRVIDHCVDHYDTFRTLCHVAGAQLDETRAYPGRSYRAMLGGAQLDDWREARFGEYGDLRMIRTPTHKLVKRYPSGPNDLFNLRTDPGETANIAGADQAASSLERTLSAELEAWYSRYEDPATSGLRVKQLRRHNGGAEAWRDGLREARGLQIY